MGEVSDLLKIARSELGNKESPANSNNVRYNTWFYGKPVSGSAYPWCAAFACWVFNKAGVKLPIKTASCGALMNAAKSAGMWVTSNFIPGDIVIYDFSGKRNKTEHCGIVELILPDYGVQAIEGNTSISGSQSNGGMVCRKNRADKYIIGAVRPHFDEEKKEEEEQMTQTDFNKMFNTAMQEYRNSLRDNDSGNWSKEARDYAISSGLFAGSGTTPDGKPNYMWEDLLTREQVAQLFYRFAQSNGLV